MAVKDEGLKNGSLDTVYILRVTLVLSIVALGVQVFYFCTREAHALPWIHMGATVMCIAANMISLACVRAGVRDYTLYLRSYAWTVYAAIVVMTISAYSSGSVVRSMPNILDLIPVIVIGVAYITGTHMSIYMAVSVITLLVFGVLFEDFGNAFSSIAATVVGGVLVGRLRKQLHVIRVAIKVLADARRDNRRTTPTD